VTSVTVQQTSAVAEAAARGRASVVKITSTRRTQSGTEQDVGSGVVIDGQGHIVTNAHVVLGTETLKVFLPDGTEQAAILVGHDSPFTDLAVLQVGPGKAVPLEIGDSAALAPGETVVAVGNPLAEFEGSVSAGVVSGLNRKRTMEGVRQDDLIQTDAALNNGNSGGALLNLKGQFVGMPTFVVRQARSSVPVEGIGFAIPASRVMEIARGIIAAGGPLPRPSLGMDHLDLTPDVSDRLSRVAVDHGALVRAVTQGGPGAAAGIQAGDVITRLAGEEISQDVPLFNVLMRLNAGQTVPVVLNRAGRIIEVEVRLGKRAQ
jgi:2-alkenal reductase